MTQMPSAAIAQLTNKKRGLLPPLICAHIAGPNAGFPRAFSCKSGFCPSSAWTGFCQTLPHSGAAFAIAQPSSCGAAFCMSKPMLTAFPAQQSQGAIGLVNITDLVSPIPFHPFQALVHMLHRGGIHQIAFGQPFSMAREKIGQHTAHMAAFFR